MDTLPLFDLNGNTFDKFCKGCEQFYPPTLEFFPPEKKGKNGLSSKCRVCHRAYQNKYHKKPEVQEKRSVWKQSWSQRNKDHIREYNRAYVERPGVREHLIERSRRPQRQAHIKAYYTSPAVRERMRLYYQRPDQLIKRHAYHKIYSQRPDIKERVRLQGIEYRSSEGFEERKREWRKEYNHRPAIRAKNHEYRHNRRAQKRNAVGTHTYEQIKQQYDRQCGKCYYCQTKVPCNRYHVDHVVPLSRGGSNDINNIVIACPKCNLSKHAKLPHEFFKGGRLL